MNPLHALMLLSECTGDDIWSVEHCQKRNVPADWIAELSDCFESSFDEDSQTIYIDQGATNQFHGVRDVDLAKKLATVLRLDLEGVESVSTTRRALVRRIKDLAEEEL